MAMVSFDSYTAYYERSQKILNSRHNANSFNLLCCILKYFRVFFSLSNLHSKQKTEEHYSNTPSNRPYSLQPPPQSRAPQVAQNGNNTNGNGVSEEQWMRNSETRGSGEFDRDRQMSTSLNILHLVLSCEL